MTTTITTTNIDNTKLTTPTIPPTPTRVEAETVKVPLRYFKPLGMDGFPVSVLQSGPNFANINSGGTSGNSDMPPSVAFCSHSSASASASFRHSLGPIAIYHLAFFFRFNSDSAISPISPPIISGNARNPRQSIQLIHDSDSFRSLLLGTHSFHRRSVIKVRRGTGGTMGWMVCRFRCPCCNCDCN